MSELFEENLIPQHTWRDIFFPGVTFNNIVGTKGTSLSSSKRQVGVILDGASYQSSVSGARVEIFASENSGLRIIDDSENAVFQSFVGGDNMGDIIVGAYDSGQGLFYDKSAGLFHFKGDIEVSGYIAVGGAAQDIIDNSGTIGSANLDTTVISGGKIVTGLLTADNITTGTLTGRVVRTSSGTTRVEMAASTNELIVYQNGNERVILGSGVLWFGTPSGVTSGAIYGFGTNQLALNTGSYSTFFNESAIFPSHNNILTSGTSSYRWNNVYSAAGNFSGTITSRDIIPSSNDSYDLGSSTYKFQDIYLTGYIRANYLNLGKSLCMNSSSSSDKLYPEYNNKIDLGKSGHNWSYLYVNYCATNIRPTTTSLNLGDSAYHWNEVNYKTLNDRGCLGVFDDGVELQDGKKVSDIEALESIKTHPKLKTVYGVPRFDYSTMPKAVYKPAPLATEDVYHEKDKKKLLFKKGEKMGEDAAETTALISIMIGSIKELSSRIKKLEQRYEKD